MGEHKHNPVAQLAKEGKLPPKPKLVTTAQARRNMNAYIRKATGMDILERAMADMGFYQTDKI